MDAKAKKYDRQLRLWGPAGQKSLEDANVLLLGATNIGCETLKNLILPGIGKFKIVDDRLVTGSNAGSNFFLTSTQIGQGLAESCTVLLSELNKDVEASYLKRSPSDMINNHLNELREFSVIILADFIHQDELVKLSEYCRSKLIPVVLARSYGFYGYFVESHIQSDAANLQLCNPPPALFDLANEISFKDCDSKTLSQIPYPVLLIRAIMDWTASTGEITITREKRNNFLDFVRAIGSNLADDENFQEAVKAQNLNVLINGLQLPDNITFLFETCSVDKAKSSPFWLKVSALERFVSMEGQGRLPFSGIVPDMKSDTEFYVRIQKIYKEQARADLQIVQRYANEIAHQLQVPAIDLDDMAVFCRNAFNLQVIQSVGGIKREFDKPTPAILQEIKQNPDSDLIYYILIRALDRFRSLNGQYPGSFESKYETDGFAFKSLLAALLKEYGITEIKFEKQTDEMYFTLIRLRAAGAELPSIAALMGGICSQEVIKLITHQYLALNNALIYNGIQSTSCTFQI